GRDLALSHPAFDRELATAAAAVDRWWDHRLLDVMWGADAEVLERTEFAQPALFAIGVALFRVVERCGVVPDFVVGHSVGELAAAGCRVRRLAVSHAFHSPLLDPVLEEFGREAARATVTAPVGGIELVSTLTGAPADFEGGYGSAEYWVRHAREAVRFAEAVT